jgi:conjugative transposon TraN protein
MGCNIGSCVTALLASTTGKKEAKRAAMIHFLFNVIGTVLMYVVLLLHADTIFYINHTQQLALQFPAEIKYVDVGSATIEVHQLSDARSLTLRARQENCANSTLSVVTANGKYYLYTLAYAQELPFLGYQIDKGPLPSPFVGIGQAKTTHFIAPYPIADWSVAPDTILSAYADGIRNMVRVKATDVTKRESSITLLGSQGRLFSYRLVYADSLPELSVQVSDSTSAEVIFQTNPMDTQLLQKLADKALLSKPTNNHIGVVEHRMQFSLAAIYSYKDWLLLRLAIQNRNDIDYDIDFIKVYITDKKGSKHTALQETEVTPFYVHGSDGIVSLLPARGQQDRILFFNRFTLPKQRILRIELFEKNGGRHLLFSVSHKELLRAKALSLP